MTTPQVQKDLVIDGKYRLVEKLGEGGIGSVWLAFQELVERKVAVKFLRGELAQEHRDRFLLEAQALGRLSHPNCITIFDFGWSEPLQALYLVMEYLEGESLAEWRDRQMPFGDVVEISKQIANALAYAHHQNVLHRDLKPENVMLVKTFTGQTAVKVLDFGLARLGNQQQRLTKTGEIFGTPAYMSPEQIRGSRNAGPRTDVYALGVMMWEMIEGKLPYEEANNAFDLMVMQMSQPFPPMSRHAPHELQRIVMRCVQKEEGARYATALELWEDLDKVGSGLDDSSSTTFEMSPHPRDTIQAPPPNKFRENAVTMLDERAQALPKSGPVPIPTMVPDPSGPIPINRRDPSSGAIPTQARDPSSGPIPTQTRDVSGPIPTHHRYDPTPSGPIRRQTHPGRETGDSSRESDLSSKLSGVDWQYVGLVIGGGASVVAVLFFLAYLFIHQ